MTGIRRRIRDALPVVVALGLVALMTVTAPDLSTPPRQWVSLTVGERGTLRDKAVTVTSVRTASAVELREQVLSTTGVFVAVAVDVDALVGPVTFARRVRLLTRGGALYDPRSEWILAAPPLTQAGFRVRGTWVFEVPAGHVAGVRLQVENESREFDGYDQGLRIDLGLDGTAPLPGALTLAEATTTVTR